MRLFSNRIVRLKLSKAILLAACLGVLPACSSLEEKQPLEIERAPYELSTGEAEEPSVVSFDDYNDPFEAINRPIFKFNNVTYTYVLSPLARTYQSVVPKPVDRALDNFFTNLKEPIYSLNNLFQGRPGKSGKSLLRFGINTTIGLLGIFDPASAWWDIERNRSTFGDTLAFYGLGYGAYLMLPILGPSDIRDGTSMTFEYFTHPLTYLDDQETRFALKSTDGFHRRVNILSNYPDIVEGSEDPYRFLRNLYLQRIQRDAEEIEKDADEGEQEDANND